MKIYTIGHSSHPIEQFIGLLIANGILILVDVRTTPFSRFNPQFNQGNLHKILPLNSVEYLYMGNTLGGRSADPTCYIHQSIPKNRRNYLHEVNYEEVMRRPWFIQGVEKLIDLAGNQVSCIMCSEGDPAQCHRHHLIAAYLLSHYPEVNVIHILRDGSLTEATTIRAIGDNNSAEQFSF
jgi:uncharacterized protein (DUF488 family)